MPAPRRKRSALRCVALPMPTEAELSEPGLAFAAATSSFTERMPFEGAITSTLGSKASGMTPVRSRSVSYGRSLYVDGVTVYEEECTKSVVPSGSDFATTAAPMVPPAPGRFSITMGCPSWGESLSVTVRAMMSVPLPGVNGTMILIGFEGQACAQAAVCAIHSAIPAARVQSFVRGLPSQGSVDILLCIILPRFICQYSSFRRTPTCKHLAFSHEGQGSCAHLRSGPRGPRGGERSRGRRSSRRRVRNGAELA